MGLVVSEEGRLEETLPARPHEAPRRRGVVVVRELRLIWVPAAVLRRTLAVVCPVVAACRGGVFPAEVFLADSALGSRRLICLFTAFESLSGG